jgi:hypothetical protein
MTENLSRKVASTRKSLCDYLRMTEEHAKDYLKMTENLSRKVASTRKRVEKRTDSQASSSRGPQALYASCQRQQCSAK